MFSTHAAAQGFPLSEALRLALSQNPDIRLQEKQVEIANAQVLQASGRFDWQVSSSLSRSKTAMPLTAYERGLYGPLSRLNTFNNGYDLAATKPLRNGMSVETTFNVAQPRADSNALSGMPDKSTRSIGIALNTPLLRGSGDSASAVENASRISSEASRQELRQQLARTLLNTLLAYWEYRARHEMLDVARSGEVRSRKLLDDTQKLIDAEELPRASSHLLQASYAERRSSRIAAEQALTESRRSLGRLLGLDPGGMESLDAPADPFPVFDQAAVSVAERAAALAEDSLKHRSDLRALEKQMEASRVTMRAVQKDLLPQVDVRLGVNYIYAADNGSLRDGVLANGWNQGGPSVSAAITYQFPVENSQARGVFRQRAAESDQLLIRHRDLTSAIVSGVRVAVLALQRSAEQLSAAIESTRLFGLTVEEEVTKQRLGMATLIDVVTVEDRLTNARLAAIQSSLNYANALGRLRFETGTLVPQLADEGADSLVLDVGELTGIVPLAGQGKRE